MVEFPLYPLTEPFERLTLALELTLVFVLMELSIYFFYKYWRNKKDAIPSVVELDWALLFGGFGLTNFFFIIADFFAQNRSVFLVIGYFTMLIGGAILVYHLESTKQLRTKYALTVLVGCIAIALLVIFIFFPSILQTTASMLMFVAFGIIAVYFFTIIKRIWKFYKFRSLGLLCGIFLWLVGQMGIADIAISLFNTLGIRALGDIFMLAGLLLIAFFVNSIPSLAEIGWDKKIKYIILTTENGISIYSEQFQERKEIDDLLVSGAVWGIQAFLQNVLSEEAQLKVISRGSDVILREEGKNVIGLLIVEQELEILKYLLKQLVEKFEELYAHILDNWTGEIDLFEPTKRLVNEIFSIEEI